MNPLYIMPDIKPYRSMIDGSLITSRSKHREHLKANNCYEVGNDVDLTPRPIPDAAPQQRKEIIVHQFSSMTDHEVRQMIRRDVQNARWNSRKD